MRSKQVASLAALDLDVGCHSRPYTSDDNPYSNRSSFMKYRPGFSERFGRIEDVAIAKHSHCQANGQHRHSGIGHYDTAQRVPTAQAMREVRQQH
jgi:hypothetical protein